MAEVMVRNLITISIGWFFVFLAIPLMTGESSIGQSLAVFALFYTVFLLVFLLFYLPCTYLLEKIGWNSFFFSLFDLSSHAYSVDQQVSRA